MSEQQQQQSTPPGGGEQQQQSQQSQQSNTPDWTSTLDDGGRQLVQAKGWKAPGDVLKSYANLEKMVGSDKVALPGENATTEQLNDFYKRLGRPEKVEDYKLPEVKLPDGAPIDDKFKTHFMTKFHEAGLTQKQAEKLYSEYMTYYGTSFEAQQASQQASMDQGIQALKTEFGDKFSVKVDTANRAFKSFASKEAIDYFDQSGLGNNPHFVRLFASIGEKMLEDNGNRGGDGGGDPFAGGPAAAMEEIKRMEGDPEIRKALLVSTHPKHKETVEKRNKLYLVAYPTPQ